MDNNGVIPVVCIFGFIILAVADYLIAKEFTAIAGLKGYEVDGEMADFKYFWYCFLFGVAGWIMVAALPNIAANGKQEEKAKNTSAGTQPDASKKMDAHTENKDSEASFHG